jgi:hypothetical protein
MNDNNTLFGWMDFKSFGIAFVVVVLAWAGLYYNKSISSNAVTTPTPFAQLGDQEIIFPGLYKYQIPLRVIHKLTIADVVPKEGKFIAADLVEMKILLYKDGEEVAQYPIKTKGRPGTPWETPAGLYRIQGKEVSHFSSIGKVYMPYSMQFYGNYFIHGWTYYADGTPTPFTFSGGCIKLETEDARKVFEFADMNTPVFVYDTKQESPPSLSLGLVSQPDVEAGAWLVADLDTGDVFAEHNAQTLKYPEFVNNLLTALVANETISFNKYISVPEGSLVHPPTSRALPKTFAVNDLFYPLLLQPNNDVVDALAGYHGSKNFTRFMNTGAQALDMKSTTFVDPYSHQNVTNTEDVYRLTWYLKNKKSFVLDIASAQEKTIVATDGSTYKISQSKPATNVSIVPISKGEAVHDVAIIVLDSPDLAGDTKKLSDWLVQAVAKGDQSACASCALPTYRKIEL